MQNLSSYFRKHKLYILGFLGVALLIIGGSLVIKYTFLKKPAADVVNRILPNKTPLSVTAVPSTITLSAKQQSVKIGDIVSVDITVFSPSSTDGIDMIINYDPKILSLQTVGKTKNAVNVSKMYDQFPINSVVESKGQILVSGIATAKGLVVPNGSFGTIDFKAISPGESPVTLVFNKGGVGGSDIAGSEKSQNILDQVVNTSITVTK